METSAATEEDRVVIIHHQPSGPAPDPVPPGVEPNKPPNDEPGHEPAGSEVGDAGMSTAEYAIGTVAACGFAGVLWAVVHSDAVARLLQGVIERALSLAT